MLAKSVFIKQGLFNARTVISLETLHLLKCGLNFPDLSGGLPIVLHVVQLPQSKQGLQCVLGGGCVVVFFSLGGILVCQPFPFPKMVKLPDYFFFLIKSAYFGTIQKEYLNRKNTIHCSRGYILRAVSYAMRKPDEVVYFL